MNRLTFLLLACAAALPAHAGTSISVSIDLPAPGQYGRIDISNHPQPRLVFAQPVIEAPSTWSLQRRPIYLYAPPSHQASWSRYCGGYGACGQPVYFVEEAWVRDEYRREHDKRGERKKIKNKDHKEHKSNHGHR